MAFDVNGAKKAGYSDAEIADFLAKDSKFDATGARKAGYSDAEIIKHLNGPSAYDRGREVNSPLEAGAQGFMSVMQGPTLGFADEIAGAVAAPFKSLVNGKPLAENYRDTRDFWRGAADQQAEERPVFSAATRIAASAPLALASRLWGAAQIAAPVTMGGRAAHAAKAGAASGAVSGLGESTAEDSQGMASDAGLGSLTGAALGGASVPASRVVGAVTGNVAARVSDSQAAKYAQAKVAEALARDARGRVAQDSLTGPLQQVQRRFDRLGPEATVADSAGANARNLLDTLATLPGRTKEATESAIRGRQAGRGSRMIAEAERSLGVNGQRLASSMDDWIEQRSRAAAPLYERVHAIDVTPDNGLMEVVRAAEDIGAHTAAKQMARAEMAPFTLSLSGPQQWSMRDLDRVKRGLDDIVAKQTAPDGKVSEYGRSVDRLRQQLIAQLDNATGGLYAQARHAWAGPTAVMDAAAKGRGVMTKDDATIRQTMAGMTASEAEAFRLGAFEALRAKLGRTGGQTEIANMWREPALQERLKAVFGDERSFRQFAASVAKESRLKGLEGVGKGSQTAARQYGAGDLDVDALAGAQQAVSGAASGNLAGMVSGVANVWNRVRTPEPVRDAMGRILLSRGAEGRNELQRMSDIAWQVQQRRLNRDAALGLLAQPTTNNLAGMLGSD